MEIRDWITVSPDNTVTVRVAQMEMGQGATTTMAQLLAEELGVDWSTLKTEPISIRTHLLRGKVYGRTRTDASRGVREFPRAFAEMWCADTVYVFACGK